MSVEENKAIVRQIYDEPGNKGNVDIIDELISEDYVNHPGMGDRQGVKQFWAQLNANAPGMSVVLEEQVAEGDLVATRWIMHLPHTREWAGIAPTGKTVTWTGMNIHRVVDGKVVEGWVVFNLPGFWKQWGFTPDEESIQGVPDSNWD